LVDEGVVGEGDQLVVTQIQLVQPHQAGHQLRTENKTMALEYL